MRIEESPFFQECLKVYELESGKYFFFEDFIVSEVKEGITFSWETAQEGIKLKQEFFGDKKISYITNRVNSYSIVPQDWLKFFDLRNQMLGLAIVTYSDLGLMNVALEKLFFHGKLKRFENLQEAVTWVKQLSVVEKEKNITES